MTSHFRIACVSFLVLLLLLGCAAAEGSRPRSAQAADVDVAAYASFGWDDRGGQGPATVLDNQVRAAIRSVLLAKGYTESADAPDFLIGHEPVEQSTVKPGSPVSIGVGVGTWGGRVGGSVGTTVGVGERERVHDEMRIAVRAIDAAGQQETWVGSTATLAVPIEGDAVTKAVTALMKQFPDRRR